MMTLSAGDRLLSGMDTALRTLFAKPHASRALPMADAPQGTLTAVQQQHAAGLMRVNHVGEICAQALYTAQALATRNLALQAQFAHAAKEETDHLAWTQVRLTQLGAKPSLLNPLWYAGAFGLGLLAGRMGDAISLGFLQETESQVEAHLASHLQENGQGLPLHDSASRAIVTQMQLDEAAHALAARDAGAQTLPKAAQHAMRWMSQVMTRVAYRV